MGTAMKKRSNRSTTTKQAGLYLDEALKLFVGQATQTGFVDTNLRRALVSVKRALILPPDNYDALILMADILGELNDSPDSLIEATELYDKAISLQPKNPKGYSAKASTLLDAGRADLGEIEARKVWKLIVQNTASLELEEGDIKDACQLLADSLIELKKPKEAIAVLRDGLEHEPTEAMANMLNNYIRHLNIS
jgi:tetratricopeptide (TPR) repeat protein